MAAWGQQNFAVVSEAAVGVVSAPQGLVMEAVVSPPALEPHHRLQPLLFEVPAAGEPMLREDVLIPDNSPRFLPQNMVQPAQQPTACYAGGDSDVSGYFQYEEFAGVLGDRVASGSLSDVPASTASEKICSGNSSSGEHYGPRLKFMCSFGGRILPRPGDGKLRYAGGDTRIVSLYHHTKYSDLVRKMWQLYGQPVVLKYQLPNEDLDALISVSCDEDVENMMEEYDRLQASEGSSRLRIFLFSPAECDVVHVNDTEGARNTDQIYMDAINGMPETRSVKHINMVSVSTSHNMTGIEVSDTWNTPRIPKNSSLALPVVPISLGIAPSLVQSTPVAMLQPNKQLLSRIFSASPSSPSSPTISSQLLQVRQPAIPDITHQFYPDQLTRGLLAHPHELQWLDASYQDVEGVGSGTSSLNSQHNVPLQPLESKRLIDSPTKAQHENMIEYSYRPEQMPMADAILPKVNPSSIMPRVDSYGRMPRVGSHSNLMPLQQQQLEIEGLPADDKLLDNHLPNIVRSPLDLQSLVIQEQGLLSQAPWQHPLEARWESFQRMNPVRCSAPENMQGIAVAPQQQFASQYYSPVITSGHEVAAFNQLDRSLDVMTGWLPQKPLAVRTTIHPPGTGVVSVSALHPGSAPPSPCLAFQENNLNYGGIQQYLPSQGGLNGGYMEQPYAQVTVPPHSSEPAARGLKPLNTYVDSREQLPCIDDEAARQQLPMPLLNLDKPQDNRGTMKKREGDNLQSYYADGLTQPGTPPLPGGSPYHEALTPFADHHVTRREGQEQVQREDGLAVYSQYQGGIDWTMKKPLNEKMSLGWTRLGQVDMREELSSDFGPSKVAENSSVLHILESSFVNSAATDGACFNPYVPLETSLMPSAVAGRSPTLGVLGASTYPPPSSETPFTNPPLMATYLRTDDQVQTSAPFSSNAFTNAGGFNSFFVAQPEEVQWIKGSEADARTMNDSGGHLIEDTSEVTANPILSDGVSGPASDSKVSFRDQTLGLPVVDGVNMIVSKRKVINAPNAHMQTTTSIGPSYPSEISGLETLPLSPRISAAKSPMGSPPPSLAVEASTASSHLTEVLKDFDYGDLVSSIPRDDFESTRAERTTSHTDRLVNTQDGTLMKSVQFSNVVERKGDFPIFDSDSMQESRHEDIRGNNMDPASKNAEAALLPPTLYTAPTLSMQNWEETLATVTLEEQTTKESLLEEYRPDEVKLHVVESEVLEMKIGGESGDTDGNKASTHMNPAAVAEAEAISRGLQTIKNADLEELRELGTGTFGTVYHGKWRGTDVAIKRIKPSCFTGRPSERERLIADFWKEAYILGQLHHPNVVAFYGVVPDGPDGTLATVTEYMVNGSLKQVLQKKDRTIDRRKRLLIIMDAAFGMEYLHGKNIVHFDLKCENLLVNMKDPQRPICKVGDLGLSKVKHQTMVSGGVRGTLPWMAPELLNGSSNLVSEKVDVFSFGIVMWELLTGEEPYANMHYGAIIGGIVNNTLRPPIPSWCDPSWKSLMERCWSADPGERPAFLEIAAELRAMANSRSQGQSSGVSAGDVTK